MKIKTHWETIDKDRCFTFFAEDVGTNTCIYSSTYILNRDSRKLYSKLKAEFTIQVMDLQVREKILIDAEIHKLKENKVPLDLNKLIS